MEVQPEILGWEDGPITQPVPDDPEAVAVPAPPANGKDIWNGTGWEPHVPAPIDWDAEIAKRDPVVQALVALVPGGLNALKAKLPTVRGGPLR